jgi:rhomboid protease GluP
VVAGIHERLLKALLLSPKPCTLVDLEAETAWLTSAEGIRIAVVKGEAPGALSRAEAAMARNTGGLLHVVLTGGGEEGRRALLSAWPLWQPRRQFAFHQVEEDATYRRLKGPALPLLPDAARRAPGLEPLAAEDLARRAEAGRGIAADEQEFADALRGTPWTTSAIAAACAVFFGLEALWGGSASPLTLTRMGANLGHAAWRAPWMLLSSAFLHIGPWHILLNMAALFSFGPFLERVLGWQRYLLLYALSALGGGVASALGHTATVSAGASGALWGLMIGGGGLGYGPHGAQLLPETVLGPMRSRALRLVAINLLYSLQPGIDLFAHLGGGLVGGALLVSGLLTIGLTRQGATLARSSGPALLGAAALAGFTMLLAPVIAITIGRPWELVAPPPLEPRMIGAMGLSISVPRGLETVRHEHEVVFGNLKHDPLALQVIYGLADRARGPEELRQSVRQMHDFLDTLKVAGATRVGAVTPARVGTLDTYRRDDKIKEVTTRTWGVALEGGDVLVRVYQHPAAQPPWTALGDRFITTMRVDVGSPKASPQQKSP